MAKYIGLLTSDARGKLGGVVLTRGRNGTNLKAKGIPINSQTVPQQQSRYRLAASANSWRALTAANRTTWAVLATQYLWLNVLAQSYSPTGQQLYAQAYMNARVFGEYPPATAPGTKPTVGVITSVQLVSSTGFMEWLASGSGGSYFGAWIIYASAPIAPTINYANSVPRRMIYYTATSNTINTSTQYPAIYGSIPPVFSNFAFKAVPLDYASFISGTPLTSTVQSVA
jgi:hypothetical protein